MYLFAYMIHIFYIIHLNLCIIYIFKYKYSLKIPSGHEKHLISLIHFYNVEFVIIFLKQPELKSLAFHFMTP